MSIESITAIAAIVSMAAVGGLYALSPESGSLEENVVVKVVDTAADHLNPFRTPDQRNQYIKEYDFTLSLNDLKYFKEAGKMATAAGGMVEQASDWRRVSLSFDGNDYDVRMKLHGDTPNHFTQWKKSYKVKTDKEFYLNKARRFNFVIAEDRRFYVSLYAEWLSEKLGLCSPHYEIGLVRINGVPQGLYVVEEKVDKDLMEKCRVPGRVVINYSDNWIEDHMDLPMGHETPFDLDISNIDEIDSDFNRGIRFQLYLMFKVVRAVDQSQFERFFEVEQVAKIEAVRAILGKVHDFTGDNMKFYYDTTKGKFGILFRSESGLGYQDECVRNKDQGVVSYGLTNFGLLNYISKNKLVEARRNEILAELFENEDELIEHFDELERRYAYASINDSSNASRSSKIAYFLREDRRKLLHNINALKNCIEAEK